MTITIDDKSLTARVAKQGSGTVTVSAGQSLKIETTPGGSELLDYKFSDSDAYTVTINVYAQKA